MSENAMFLYTFSPVICIYYALVGLSKVTDDMLE